MDMKRKIWWCCVLFIPFMILLLAISCWVFNLYHKITWENIDKMAYAVNFTLMWIAMLAGPIFTIIGIILLNNDDKKGIKK